DGDVRDRAREQARQEVDSPEGEGDATRAADRGEKAALDQELPDQAAAAGPEGGVDRDLAAAVGRAREQQVADVGGGDEQDEADRTQQDQERRPACTPRS